MKLELDEKMKHRLIGLAVIISIATIFAPAMMRKSSQQLQNTMKVRIAVPAKPKAPDVAVTDEQELFKTIKIAKNTIPTVSTEKQLPESIKAEALTDRSSSQHPADKKDALSQESQIAKIEEPLKAQTVTILPLDKKPSKIQKASHDTLLPTTPKQAGATKLTPTPPVKAPPITSANSTAPQTSSVSPSGKQDIYALQLASFSQVTNADSLASKLRAKGYKVAVSKVGVGSRTIYKVIVGHSPNRNEVLQLKNQLASALQLKGFVVNTGVS